MNKMMLLGGLTILATTLLGGIPAGAQDPNSGQPARSHRRAVPGTDTPAQPAVTDPNARNNAPRQGGNRGGNQGGNQTGAPRAQDNGTPEARQHGNRDSSVGTPGQVGAGSRDNGNNRVDQRGPNGGDQRGNGHGGANDRGGNTRSYGNRSHGQNNSGSWSNNGSYGARGDLSRGQGYRNDRSFSEQYNHAYHGERGGSNGLIGRMLREDRRWRDQHPQASRGERARWHRRLEQKYGVSGYFSSGYRGR